MPNIKQIIAMVTAALLTWLANTQNVGLPSKDVTEGIVGIFLVVYGYLAHDANETSQLWSKTTWVGAINGLFWLVGAIFHLDISLETKTTISGILLAIQNYYTLNHSSAVHELQGTVGVISPTFANK